MRGRSRPSPTPVLLLAPLRWAPSARARAGGPSGPRVLRTTRPRPQRRSWRRQRAPAARPRNVDWLLLRQPARPERSQPRRPARRLSRTRGLGPVRCRRRGQRAARRGATRTHFSVRTGRRDGSSCCENLVSARAGDAPRRGRNRPRLAPSAAETRTRAAATHACEASDSASHAGARARGRAHFGSRVGLTSATADILAAAAAAAPRALAARGQAQTPPLLLEPTAGAVRDGDDASCQRRAQRRRRRRRGCLTRARGVAAEHTRRRRRCRRDASTLPPARAVSRFVVMNRARGATASAAAAAPAAPAGLVDTLAAAFTKLQAGQLPQLARTRASTDPRLELQHAATAIAIVLAGAWHTHLPSPAAQRCVAARTDGGGARHGRRLGAPLPVALPPT